MSTIMTALIILIISIGLPYIFIRISKRKNRKQKEVIFHRFSQEGIKQGLSFSSQEILENKILGLDGLKRTLLIFNVESTGHTSIALDEVTNCTVEKNHIIVPVGNSKNPETEKHLSTIDLKFTFKNAEPIPVTFYEYGVNNIYELEELTATAKKWEAILSKMIVKEHRARA